MLLQPMRPQHRVRVVSAGFAASLDKKCLNCSTFWVNQISRGTNNFGHRYQLSISMGCAVMHTRRVGGLKPAAMPLSSWHSWD